MFLHSLPVKSRNELACDLFDTFATHSGLGQKWQHSQSRFHDFSNMDCLSKTGPETELKTTVYS